MIIKTHPNPAAPSCRGVIIRLQEVRTVLSDWTVVKHRWKADMLVINERLNVTPTKQNYAIRFESKPWSAFKITDRISEAVI